MTESRLSAVSLANLSLGAAFALSSLFTLMFGANIVEALGIRSILRILQPYQQQLVLVTASYWLPAVLIYVVARFSRVDSYLQPSQTAFTLILAANFLLVLYLAARIAAATVPGGGAGFAVAAFSLLIVVPAWVMLAIGFGMIVRRALAGGPWIAGRARRFADSDVYLVLLALFVPAVLVMTLPIEKLVVLAGEFSRLCKTADIKVLESVKPAKSIALLPDSFTAMQSGLQAETRSEMHFLLNQSMLEFVERPATKAGVGEGASKYERVTTVGRRHLRGTGQPTQYAFEPLNEITAEYVVRPAQLKLERGAEVGLGGARIEIRRRHDEKLIAFAQYYWNNTEFRVCPERIQRVFFVYDFVAGALNAKNPDGIK